MSDLAQSGLIALAVLGAGAYLARHAWRSFTSARRRRQMHGGCDKCGG